jgi:hypothetical protein
MHLISCLFRNIGQKTAVPTAIFSVYSLLPWRAPVINVS